MRSLIPLSLPLCCSISAMRQHVSRTFSCHAKSLTVTVLLFSCCASGFGQVPGTLSYQGILLQTDGITPVADGGYSVVLNFYTSATGGSPLLSRTVSATTAKGLFTCVIGGGTAPNAPLSPQEMDELAKQQIYVGIAVDGAPELVPRAQFTATPYAYRAESITNTSNPTGGRVPFWGPYNTLGSNDGFVWDNTSLRLGLGTSTPHAALQIKSSLANRKIVLYEDANNDHDFFGFGINTGALRYQVGTSSAHIFYGATSSSGSRELLRIDGPTGNVSFKGELLNTNVSSSANLIPIAYGSVNANGSILNSGTGNWTVTYYTCNIFVSISYYEIDIGEETVASSSHVVLANVEGTMGFVTPRWAKSINCGGSDPANLQIITYDKDGAVAQRGFSFTVHKP